RRVPSTAHRRSLWRQHRASDRDQLCRASGRRPHADGDRTGWAGVFRRCASAGPRIPRVQRHARVLQLARRGAPGLVGVVGLPPTVARLHGDGSRGMSDATLHTLENRRMAWILGGIVAVLYVAAVVGVLYLN